jgi:hypothetical protein
MKNPSDGMRTASRNAFEALRPPWRPGQTGNPRGGAGQCCGGSTLGSIVQHLRDEDVKGRKGSWPQTRP